MGRLQGVGKDRWYPQATREVILLMVNWRYRTTSKVVLQIMATNRVQSSAMVLSDGSHEIEGHVDLPGILDSSVADSEKSNYFEPVVVLVRRIGHRRLCHPDLQIAEGAQYRLMMACELK